MSIVIQIVIPLRTIVYNSSQIHISGKTKKIQILLLNRTFGEEGRVLSPS